MKVQPWQLILVLGGAVYLFASRMKNYLLPPVLPARMRNDAMGLGHFGAPRGDRTHKGLDIIAAPGATVRAPLAGVVKRIGYVYPGNFDFQFVEIQGANGDLVRLMYVTPSPGIVRQAVNRGDIVGTAQPIAAHHGGGMINHVHLDLKREGKFLDPLQFFELVT
jgi:murein DD-endopeptidase MepM/ murein hydrolase activator NlpD